MPNGTQKMDSGPYLRMLSPLGENKPTASPGNQKIETQWLYDDEAINTKKI